MFSKIISDTKIPPNFLNSILTNKSLYDMFKNDYENNLEYFQNRNKQEYLYSGLEFIENTLFSGNIYHIYDESTLENRNTSLEYIRNFYDDFMLEEFKKDPENLLKTKFFRGVRYAFENDDYASKVDDFISLYDYAFKESLNYEELTSIILKPILSKLYDGSFLNLSEFDLLCDYVKNNTAGYVNMNIVTNMIKNHAFKANHIFDRDVVKELIKSTTKDYMDNYNLKCFIEFKHSEELEKGELSYKFEPNIITLDENLITSFIGGNYVELFNALFYYLSVMKQALLFKENRVDYETLKVLMNMINEKVDLEKIFIDDTYMPYSYFADLKTSAFIKVLRFYQSFGVDLFGNYADNKLSTLEITEESECIPKKEISLEIMFASKMSKLDTDKIKALLSAYPVLKVFYDETGARKRTIDLVKKITSDEHHELILTYLRSRIIEPEIMIEDVSDLLNYKAKNETINETITTLLKYIYVDSFNYSVNSYLLFNETKSSFDKQEYLDDLTIKINCLKDSPLSHNFIDEALFVIEEMKQN